MNDSNPERRTSQPLAPEARAKLIGEGLGKATDDLVALCWPMNEHARTIVSVFLAELLGRATSLAASAILTQIERIDSLEQTIGNHDRRLRTQASKLSDAHLRIDARAEQFSGLADRVEALEKAVGDDGPAQ